MADPEKSVFAIMVSPNEQLSNIGLYMLQHLPGLH